jgi:hypothetical protein
MLRQPACLSKVVSVRGVVSFNQADDFLMFRVNYEE